MYKYMILFLISLFIWSFFIEPNLIVIKKYRSDKFFGKKIVFASDFHISKNDRTRLKRIIKLINKQKPDLVISGGDYIKGHTGKTTLDIETIAHELSKINAPVISVLGNHDGWYDKYRVKKALETNGITVLMNKCIKVADISVAGVEDMQTGRPEPQIALEEADSPSILVSHTPDIYPSVNQKVDLILAGHVHGGQVRIPFKGAILVPSKYGTKYSMGDINENGNRMIITKGLGTSILNIRFNTVPEIVVIE